MATRTTTPKKVEYRSKSDHARALFREGKTVAEVTKVITTMGYAFAYGIAKKMDHPDGGTYAAHAANRRAAKSISTVGDDVIVEIVTPEGVHIGTVTVNRGTGKVTTRKVKTT